MIFQKQVLQLCKCTKKKKKKRKLLQTLLLRSYLRSKARSERKGIEKLFVMFPLNIDRNIEKEEVLQGVEKYLTMVLRNSTRVITIRVTGKFAITGGVVARNWSYPRCTRDRIAFLFIRHGRTIVDDEAIFLSRDFYRFTIFKYLRLKSLLQNTSFLLHAFYRRQNLANNLA